MTDREDNQFYQALCQAVSGAGAVRLQEWMRDHTTFRVGGPAAYFICPQNSRELAEVLELCRREGCPWFILGNGSNLLVSDKGFAGAVISMEGFADIRVEDSLVAAGAGALLSQIARKAWEAELTGLEFAAGIPGTLGGGTVMNAGAYGGELKDVLEWVRVLTPEGREEILPAKSLDMGYRTSSLQKNGAIVVEAGLRLAKGEKEVIKGRMEELAAARREKQPLEYPSAGSTFKRPQGYFAGKLIQDAGLRGKQIGGAQVAEKHCGFIINRDHASARDIWQLCACVAREVKEKFNVELELEVRVLGDFSD